MLTEAECESAGALVAARHARERRVFPLLPALYEDPVRAADLVRSLLSFCDGVAVLDVGGALIGFLMSCDSVPDPSSPMARYLPQRSATHLVAGHAVVADVDASRAYARLFGELAANALDRGVVDHVVHVPIGDRTAETAWVALGFGRMNAVAIRDLAPVDRPDVSDLQTRVASPDELDIVAELQDEEAVFHASSPMFRPYVRDETSDAVRAQLAAALASDDHAFVIARRNGIDVGVISIEPGLGSPLYVPDAAVYIAATAVLPDQRGSGVGAALVHTAFEWATDRGYRAACLHFSTANATSTSFWTGIGFTPVMIHMRRRLDERILTSRPPT